MTHKNLFRVLLLFVISLTLTCGNETSVAGNSTQTGNPKMLVGTIYKCDEVTPAPNASVKVRKREFTRNADSISSSLQIKTDENGVFGINSLETGMYAIETVKDSQKAFTDSVLIRDPATTVRVCDTLKPTGRIKGQVVLAEGGDPRKILILTAGSNRIASPDSDGVFILDKMAQAAYDLRITPTMDNYEVRDTFNIQVRSGETTDLDTLYMKFTGIPSVKNLSAQVDTLKQTVELRWSRVDCASVTGFNVYRKNLDSVSVPNLLVGSVEDTLFVDSIETPGDYVYRVSSVDTSGNEGEFRDGLEIEITSPITRIDSFGGSSFLGQITDIEPLKDGRIVVTDGMNNNVLLLDSAGEVIKKIGDAEAFSFPNAVTVDDSSNFYILEMLGEGKIQKYSEQGEFVRSWTVGAYCSDLVFRNSNLYVIQPGKLLKIDIMNDTATDVALPLQNAFRLALKDSTLLVTTQISKQVAALDMKGNTDTSWGLSGYVTEIENPGGIDNYSKERLVVADNLNGYLYVLDNNGSVVTRTGIATTPEGQDEIPAAKRPYSVVYDKSSGTVLIADYHHVYRYRISVP
ncbi:MAG: hypothetical protein ACLFQB_11685 [Chitinispirillaceae bacterium]